LVGVTNPDNKKREPFLDQWLQKKFNASMDFFERNKDLRLGIKKPFPESKNVIMVGLNYFNKKKNPNLSSYLKSTDYHFLLKEKLNRAARDISNAFGPFKYRAIVDSYPALEVQLAQKAGLGFIGKNTLLINPKFGSYIFLGGLFTSLDLEFDQPFKEDGCGTCTLCLDQCPTNAFPKERVMDSRKCISFWTTAFFGNEIDPKIKLKLKPYAYGCDLCQTVCPYNKKPIESKMQSLFPKDSLAELEKKALVSFRKNFKPTSINYMGKKRFLRNIQALKECIETRKAKAN